MKIKGKHLVFLQRVEPDGTATEEVDSNDFDAFDDTEFEVRRLSITNDTYIASGMNTYVVRVKGMPQWEVERSNTGDYYVNKNNRTIGEMHEGLTWAEAELIAEVLND